MQIIMKHKAMVIAASAAMCYSAHLSVADDNPDYREENLTVARSAYSHVETNANVQVGNALLADRSRGVVEIIAESTGMPKDEPVEFALIGSESGHSYEALAVSFAAPSEIHRALEFIGIPAGQGVDYSALRVWPKGERVIVEFAPYTTNDDAKLVWTRLEDCVLNDLSAQSLQREGFVFTGSYEVDLEDARGTNRYAADVFGPHSIISLYNEPQTVLDVPRIAAQSEVYNQQVLDPKKLLKAGTLLRMRFSLDTSSSIPRSIDFDVGVQSSQSQTNAPSLLYSVADASGTKLLSQASLNQLLAFFGTYTAKNRDIFLNFSLDDALTIKQLNPLFAFFDSINKPNGCRLNPPHPGKLHYRAFLPDMSYTNRQERPGQPWELYLHRETDGTLTGKLTHIEEVWQDQGDTVSFRETTYPAPTPADLKPLIQKHEDTLKVVFIFCPPNTTYAEASVWYSALYPEYRTVYFYPTSQEQNAKDGERNGQ